MAKSPNFTNVPSGASPQGPQWAMGMRIEDIRPTFDVFCLGKLLWAMVSGRPYLRLWYFRKPEFNLESILPETPGIGRVNELLARCVVEEEADCLPDATHLLSEVDSVVSRTAAAPHIFDPNADRACTVCGIGRYGSVADRGRDDMLRFGLRPADDDRRFKIFTCNYCGNVQLFAFSSDEDPPAWHARQADPDR